MLASHFCCDILIELKQRTNAELQGEFQFYAGVRTLLLGSDKKQEKLWQNGEKGLRRAVSESFKLLRQIVETSFVKYSVPFKVDCYYCCSYMLYSLIS